MLVSAIQQSESAIIIHTPPLSWAYLPSPHCTPLGRHRLGSLCYTTASHKLTMYHYTWQCLLGLPWCSDGKESACNTGDLGSGPGLGRSPGGGHGNPLQHSRLENPMDRGAWRATVRGVTKEWDTAEHSAQHSRMCIYIDATFSIHPTHSLPFLWCPLVSISSLQIGLSIPFFLGSTYMH